MTGYRSLIFACALMLSPLLHAGEDTQASLMSEAPKDAKVYIISPQDGEKVPKTFIVKFGLSGMGVAPAGVDRDKTGHHHLLIDVDEMPDMTKPLPATDNIVHFGGGQTETEVTLPPGKHTLQLVLGNYLHIPHKKPVMSEKITVEVE
ncbi:DUF4399 domain-containing protein [Microbulbifer magnicolonia]|uniref:DUF4399 domain-containing protein n=1 Tax=Microbulbifer magnicolonia TaxID=3109744 RepID=UPI002B401A48|nr:DUF4399 domain-containing protein [Microbulbifer sp. GG15]